VRYVLNQSTIWQTELVIYLMLAATLVGMPYVQKLRGHVNVDLIPIYLRGGARSALAYVSGLVSFAVVVIMAVHSAHLWWEAWANDWYSDTVWGVPLWIPYLILPVGFGLMALQYIADLLALMSGRRKPFDIEKELEELEG
jgi:TRAP-type C4-dicarboxylate transport system permease small subunit